MKHPSVISSYNKRYDTKPIHTTLMKKVIFATEWMQTRRTIHATRNTQQSIKKTIKKQVNQPSTKLIVNKSSSAVNTLIATKAKTIPYHASTLSTAIEPCTLIATPSIVEHPSMIIECISKTTSDLPILPHLPDVTPEATRKAIHFSSTENGSLSRDHKRTTTTSSSSKSHAKYYTSGRLVNNETFTKHIDFILSTVLPSPNQTDDENERRANLAAYFLDWHLNNAFDLAITEFKRKFRK